MKKQIEPFIILPQGRMQERLYFGSDYIKRYEYELLNIANKGIANVLFESNVIRVHVIHGSLVVLHLYPTKIKESFSGRLGQKVIIGYIINKRIIYFKLKKTIQYVNGFFNEIQKVCENSWAYRSYIPNSLLLNSVKDSFTEKLTESLVQFDLLKTPENSLLEDIYRRIKIQSFLHKDYSFVRENGKYSFVPDRKLRHALMGGVTSIHQSM